VVELEIEDGLAALELPDLQPNAFLLDVVAAGKAASRTSTSGCRPIPPLLTRRYRVPRRRAKSPNAVVLAGTVSAEPVRMPSGDEVAPRAGATIASCASSR
jgi:hypothetical protein